MSKDFVAEGGGVQRLRGGVETAGVYKERLSPNGKLTSWS